MTNEQLAVLLGNVLARVEVERAFIKSELMRGPGVGTATAFTSGLERLEVSLRRQVDALTGGANLA
jgi:hypothetical protein